MRALHEVMQVLPRPATSALRNWLARLLAPVGPICLPANAQQARQLRRLASAPCLQQKEGKGARRVQRSSPCFMRPPRLLLLQVPQRVV